MCIYIYSNTLYNDINNNRTTGAYVYIYIYIYVETEMYCYITIRVKDFMTTGTGT